MTTQQYSYVVAAFQRAYTVMQPIAGYILDFVGRRTRIHPGGPETPRAARSASVGSLIDSRKLVIVCGAVLMIGPACIGLAASPYVAIALFCTGAFAHQAISGALFTLASDVFGQHEVGTATGFSGMCGWLGGMIFSLIVGALATTLGYNPLFVCLMLFDVIGATVAWKLITYGESSAVESAVVPAASAAVAAELAVRQTSGR